MQAQLMGGQNEGLPGLADAAGGSGMGGMGIAQGSEGGMQGAAQPHGMSGFAAMEDKVSLGGKGQAAPQAMGMMAPGTGPLGNQGLGGVMGSPVPGRGFPGTGMGDYQPIPTPEDIGPRGGMPGLGGGGFVGGQQLAAEEPINAQQMAAMMPVMPNVGGDGSALGLGVGGMWDIHQTGVNKI